MHLKNAGSLPCSARSEMAYTLCGCTENVTPCFIVFDPAIIDGAYKITLNSSEKKLLKIDDSSNVRCLSIAVVPEDYKKTTVNMKCPIVINSDENLAAQVILPEKYEIRLPIYVDKGAK